MNDYEFKKLLIRELMKLNDNLEKMNVNLGKVIELEKPEQPTPVGDHVMTMDELERICEEHSEERKVIVS